MTIKIYSPYSITLIFLITFSCQAMKITFEDLRIAHAIQKNNGFNPHQTDKFWENRKKGAFPKSKSVENGDTNKHCSTIKDLFKK